MDSQGSEGNVLTKAMEDNPSTRSLESVLLRSITSEHPKPGSLESILRDMFMNPNTKARIQATALVPLRNQRSILPGPDA